MRQGGAEEPRHDCDLPGHPAELGPEPKSTRYRPPGGARRRAGSGRGERRRTSERGGGARPSKMAPSASLRPLSRLLAPARLPSGSPARSKFYVREPPNDKPDWLKVGLTLGSSAFLWIYLIKQHNEDVLEYKRRNGLE